VPADIPIGIYTHLNFAFAAIDPDTFAVVPASPGDTALYTQVTGIKKLQPGLKVFISIGGWTFSDPGPTATTFSDLAASSSNQEKFFTSLVSFMSTYDFDGVDIDW
jgi:chitinase